MSCHSKHCLRAAKQHTPYLTPFVSKPIFIVLFIFQHFSSSLVESLRDDALLYIQQAATFSDFEIYVNIYRK